MTEFVDFFCLNGVQERISEGFGKSGGAGLVNLLVSGALLVSSKLALTDVKCRNTRPTGKIQKLSDGGGLQLWVQPTGSRLSRFAYRFESAIERPFRGRQRTGGIWVPESEAGS